VGGTLAGSTTYSLISYLVAPHRPRLSFEQQAIRSLVRFGRWIFVTGLINTAGVYLLRVVISRQLGTAELGLFFLASQLAFLPSEVANEVIGSVAFPLFARLQSDLEQLARAFRTVVNSIAAFLFPVCALLMALAPSLVNEVLGPRWAGTVPVIQVLALACLVSLPGEAIIPLFNGFGQPYKVTILETLQSLLLIVFASFLTNRFGLPGAALTWIPALIGSLLLGLFFIRQILVKPLAQITPFLAVITLISGLGALVSAGIDSFLPGLVGLIVATVLAVIAIVVMLWLSDRRLSLGLRADLGQLFPQIASFIGYSPAD
jgi:PST family polysaccharide transporter